MLDKKQLTEEEIKLQFITPSITAKWDLHMIGMERKITDGKINLKGNLVFREKPKRADYVLNSLCKPYARIQARLRLS